GGASTSLGQILTILGENAAGDIDRLRSAIEEWFDTGMDRVSCWYKRWTQLWQFVIGLALAILLNVNAVSIATDLWTNIPMRNAIVGQAVNFAKNPSPILHVTEPSKTDKDFNIEVEPETEGGDVDRLRIRVVLNQDVAHDTLVTLKTT